MILLGRLTFIDTLDNSSPRPFGTVDIDAAAERRLRRRNNGRKESKYASAVHSNTQHRDVRPHEISNSGGSNNCI